LSTLKRVQNFGFNNVRKQWEIVVNFDKVYRGRVAAYLKVIFQHNCGENEKKSKAAGIDFDSRTKHK